MDNEKIKKPSDNSSERLRDRPIARRLRFALGATADRLMDPVGHHRNAVIERYLRRNSETPSRGLGRQALRYMVNRAAPQAETKQTK